MHGTGRVNPSKTFSESPNELNNEMNILIIESIRYIHSF